MQSLTDDERRLVLGEILVDELKVSREYVQDVPEIKDRVTSIDDRLKVVETDVKIIKKVVRQHSFEIKTLQSSRA